MNTFRIVFKYVLNGQIKEQYLDIGLIQEITNSYEIKTMTQGIPSQPSQNAFAMDYGTSRSYTFSYLRVCPDAPVDDITDAEGSLRWSNGFWAYVIKRYVVNRWQTQTDGIRIIYTSADESQYPTLPQTNAYVSAFTVEEKAGNTRTLSGKITFAIGSNSDLENANRKALVYEANYDTYSHPGDDTNYVRATVYGSIDVMGVPTSWIAQANNYGIYPIGMNETLKYQYFRWSLSPTELVPEFGYKEGDLIYLEDTVTTLYARYNTTDPQPPDE